MENQDKIYTQFKKAAEKSELNDFPNMDKVWNRVEEKLDKKVLKKQNKLWKKIAVAASILLVASIGYQLLKPNSEIETPQNNIVIIDTIQDGVNNSESTVATITTDSISIFKKDAEKILDKAISTQSQIAINENNIDPNVSNDYAPIQLDANEKEELENKSNGYLAKRKFNAIGVQYTEDEEAQAKVSEKAQEASQKKEEPLLIIDNTAITTKNVENYSTISKDELAKINASDIQTVTYLKEPLYVIDGKQYSEQEMFGPNPTSPYAPLSIQEIKKTVVLQGKEALAAYGKKGEKGVLVITTKYGKPAKKAIKKP